MSATLSRKQAALRRLIRESGGMLVAFSGGVDSTLLAAVARSELGSRALAVTALSPTYPAEEQREAARLARRIGIRHRTVLSNELKIRGFAANPTDRCYHCKRELFGLLRRMADRERLPVLADGSNADDVGDYRPGRKAAMEWGVRSPLLEAKLTKSDIRALSRALGLPTADKPSFACLASRFPYGTRITEAKLKAVDAVEQEVRRLGFRQVRVRYHGDVARIEVEPAEMVRLLRPAVRQRIAEAVRGAGFRFAALDLTGYRTGSMNEGLGLTSPGRRGLAAPRARGRN